jgi:predicted TPR repeat methyltransferase
VVIISYVWDIKTGYATRSGRYKTKMEWEFIKSNLPKNKLNILDIGGGSGRFAIPLTKLGNEVTVVDINQEALRILRKRNKQVNVQKENFLDYNSNEKFDLILAIEALGNFHDLGFVFKKINNLLKKDSLFIFTVANLRSLKYKARKRTSYPSIHNFEEYKKLLEKNRFKILKNKGFNWLPLKVNSNSKLVPFFVKIESILRLDKCLKQSPELLFCAKKIG